MSELLKSKNLATRFQILIEVAAQQPNVEQKAVASKLGITSQAVSEYVKDLIRDGWLTRQGRSRYRVTRVGVDWMLRMNRQLHGYSSHVSRVVSDISTTAAIAAENLSMSQRVWLYMQDGFLYASASSFPGGASGVTVTAAQQGQDVGVSKIEGVIQLEPGPLVVCTVPDVEGGGSQAVDVALLQAKLQEAHLVGAIGVEALLALRRVGREPDQLYGVKEGAAEAAYCGLAVVVVCTEDDVQGVLEKFEEEGLSYRLADVSLTTDRTP
ncbi:MAG: MarR family transcriptional regulator [Chloroflexota bacterium]